MDSSLNKPEHIIETNTYVNSNLDLFTNILNSLEAASAAAPVNTRSVVVQDGSNATPASVFDLTTTKWSLGFWFKSDENVGSGNNFSTYGGTAPGGGGATYGRTLLMSSNQASHN